MSSPDSFENLATHPLEWAKASAEERRNGNGRAHEVAPPWEAPIPFDVAEPEPFPTEQLPGWVAEWVREEAVAGQVPEDLPGVLAIGACSAALARRARVEVKPGYLEPLNLFLVSALPPANRKSGTFAHATAPLLEHEAQLADLAGPQVAKSREEIALLRERVLALRRAAASSSKSEEEQEGCRKEATKLAVEISEKERRAPVYPRLLCDDVTPEALGVLLKEQGGRMGLFSAEGGEIFALMGGRYVQNAKPNVGVFLSGHAGDPLRVDRAKRDPVFVDAPALTLCLCVQPEVVRHLSAAGEFRGRGLLGRILFSMPKSPLGSRDARSPSMSEAVRRGYAEGLQRLLDLPLDNRIASLDPDAAEAWFAFAEEIEPRLAEQGDLGQLGDWAGKLPGAVARMAGVLHAMEWADRPAPFEGGIERLAVERAIALARYFIAHTCAAFSLMGADDDLELARRVWGWIRQEQRAEVSKRDVYQQLKGGLVKRVAQLEGPLGVLVEHQYLRRKAREKKPGRQPELYEVNPEALR